LTKCARQPARRRSPGVKASDERRSSRLKDADGAPACQFAGGQDFGYERPVTATPRRIEYGRSDAIVIERFGRAREGRMKLEHMTGADADVLGMVRLNRTHHREHGCQQEQTEARHDQGGRTCCAMLGPVLHQRASRRMASEDVCARSPCSRARSHVIRTSGACRTSTRVRRPPDCPSRQRPCLVFLGRTPPLNKHCQKAGGLAITM